MAPSLDVSTLYYGDNLDVLREHVPSESVDLVYLDPPFNSNRDYNVLFAESEAKESEAQIQAFEDTWHWDRNAEETWRALTDPGAEDRGVPTKLIALMEALRPFLGDNDMLAYLTMMAIRLVELRRVLKPTGSLYLHCDPTASHYLKLTLDAIFGAESFRNEIVWKRANAHNDPKRYGRVSDTIFYYSKGDSPTWNQQHTPYREEYYESHFKKDEDGRWFRTVPLDAPRHGEGSPGLLYEWKGKLPSASRTWAVKREIMEQYEEDGLLRYTRTGTPTLLQYADEMRGVPLQNVWTDIPPVNPQAKERLGYPTQKPLALLERIIAASSNEGDVVLDPFCGCGTAVHAAQRLKREWIGIDVTHLAIALIRNRLDTAFPGIKYEVKGEPADVDGARALAESDPYQFQWWALHLVGARPVGDGTKKEGKKGKDRGVDGVIRFKTHPQATQSERVIVSVKAGHNLNPGMVRDLRGVIEREQAPIGVLLTMHAPTKEMRAEAAKAGDWTPTDWDRAFPRIQIVTVEEAFNGRRIEYPGIVASEGDAGDWKAKGGSNTTLKAAPKEAALALPGFDPAPTGGRGKRRK